MNTVNLFPEGFGMPEPLNEQELWDRLERLDRIVPDRCSGCNRLYDCDNTGYYEQCKGPALD